VVRITLDWKVETPSFQDQLILALQKRPRKMVLFFELILALQKRPKMLAV